METVFKIWDFFSGKKTAIGAILFALSDIAVALGYPEISGPLKNIAYIFTGTGLGHKATKAIK